jgi:hypothetical protein
MAKHRPFDARLKIAIIESHRSQRRVALDTRIGEVRMSALVRQRGAPATDLEKERLAKYLKRSVDELFGPDPVEPIDPLEPLSNVTRMP